MSHRPAWSHSLALLAVLGGFAASGCAARKQQAHLEKADAFFAKGKFAEAAIEYRNALKLDPNDPRATTQFGLAVFELGDPPRALEALERARKLDSKNVQVLVKLGTVHYLQGNLAEARKVAADALGQDKRSLDAALLYAAASALPEEIDAAIRVLEQMRAEFGASNARFHIALAQLLGRKGDTAGAEEALAQGTSVEPGLPLAHFALGRFYLGQKDLESAEREFQQAAGGSAADDPARMALAEFYVGTGRPEEARKVLQAITEQAPKSLPAWRRLAGLALQEGQLDACAKALEGLFGAAPQDPVGRLLRGELALRRQDAKTALADFTELMKLNPRFPPTALGLAKAQLLSGQIDEARKTLDELIRNAPTFDQAALLLATIDLATGQGREAVGLLEKLAEKTPSERVLELLAAAHLSAKQSGPAAEAARKLIALAPEKARGHALLGLALRQGGKNAEARSAFEQALANDPEAIDALRQLVALDFADQQPDAALARVKRLVEAKPDSGPLLLMLGDVHAFRKESAEAEAAYGKALDRDPSLAVAYLRLAALYAGSGRPEAAVAKVAEALAKDPKNLRLTMLYGLLSQQTGDRPRAIEAFEKALELDAKFVPALNNLAYLYIGESGKEKRALELAETARKAAPDDANVADTYGFALYRQGQYQAALEPLLQSAGKLPDNPEVQYHLGMTYFQLGQKERASEALTKALAGQATFPGADEARQTLAKLK